MMRNVERTLHGRVLRAVVAGAMTLTVVGSASADDAGVHDFFRSMFGGASRPVSQQPDYGGVDRPAAEPRARHVRFRRLAFVRARPESVRPHPLTVRLHRDPAPRPTSVADAASSKPAVVSIYEDRTLRPGDAVMTADGIRIFAGSTSWPYTKRDFVRIDKATDLKHSTVKMLAELDSLPRS